MFQRKVKGKEREEGQCKGCAVGCLIVVEYPFGKAGRTGGEIVNAFNKGKEVLLQCGVVDTTYSQLSSMPNGKGCNLEFTSHVALQHAHSQVLATSLSFGMSGTRKIWCGLTLAKHEMSSNLPG